MGDAAGYAYIAMAQAITDAKLTDEQVSNFRTGIVAGSGGASSANIVASTDTLRSRGIRRVGPYAVPKTMGSTVSACLATPYKIKGVNYSISSACATSAHCIGNAMELIQLGKQDIVFAGGGEEVDWSLAMMFDGMGALSAGRNDTPELASRTYDANRDGFVISGGGGMVVVEELEHALARGAHIYAEIVGYGATSDGYDMVAPSGEGAVRCMQQAMQGVTGEIDYLKTGHALGAAGVHEAIYSILMMENNFVAPSINIENLDEQAEGLDIVTQKRDVELNLVMSNSFGFGGTNATLVMQKYKA
jgi:3-oxoacyl-[acyl-carrier-protein] synthase-1